MQGDVVTADTLLPEMFRSEAHFHRKVETMAAARGWLSFHDRDSRKNVAGLPDLLLIRERLVWMELKYGRGKLNDDQKAFIAALRAAGQEVYVCWPGDLKLIEKVLA